VTVPERLIPPQARATSVARVPAAWYVACESRELREAPIQRTILGAPIVLFRGASGPGALLDRCPHRNVPLSLGRVHGGELVCGYHGWRFEPGGACTAVPALCDRHPVGARAATAYPCREQDGFVWVWADPEREPDVEPYRFRLLGAKGYTSVRQHLVAPASVHATAENALDVPHTSFLHAGLFRSDDRARNEIEVVVRREADRVEAEYLGEPRPEGLVGRVLSPRGGVVSHWDRFLLPSIVEVEYRLDAAHVLVSAALTPAADFETHLYAVVSFELPVPGWLVVPFVRPIALRIFGQDAALLARQTENIARFGGERYVSTEVDVLGPSIRRLLRAAERGELAAMEAPVERRLRMEI